jgi:hypothetical protein
LSSLCSIIKCLESKRKEEGDSSHFDISRAHATKETENRERGISVLNQNKLFFSPPPQSPLLFVSGGSIGGEELPAAAVHAIHVIDLVTSANRTTPTVHHPKYRKHVRQ